MLGKVKKILITNATNLTITLAEKEDSDSFFGTFLTEIKQLRKIKTSKKNKEYLELDFEKISEHTILHLKYKELEELCFHDSNVEIIDIGANHKLEWISCVSSKCKIQKLFKESFRITGDDYSDINVSEYLLNHARFETTLSSNINLHKGAVHFASIYSFIHSEFRMSGAYNYFINVKNLYANELPFVDINVINHLRYTLMEHPSSSIYIKGNPSHEVCNEYIDSDCNICYCDSISNRFQINNLNNDYLLYESIKQNYLKLNDNFEEFSFAITESTKHKKIIFPDFINESSDSEPSLVLNLIENEKEKMKSLKYKISESNTSSSIDLNLTEIKLGGLTEYTSIKKKYESLIKSTKRQQKIIKKNNSDLIASYNTINNNILKLDYETANTVKKNLPCILPEDDEQLKLSLDIVDGLSKKINSLYIEISELENREKIKTDKYKKEEFLFNIVKHDFPTDYITPENREKVIHLLSSHDSFFDYFEEKELEQINRLKTTFNIKKEKKLCSFLATD